MFSKFVFFTTDLCKNTWVTFVSICQTAAVTICFISSDKNDTYAHVVYPKAKLKKIVKFLFILDVLWCGVNARQDVNHSPPQVFALVNVLLIMLAWDAGIVPFFFVNKYRHTGNNKVSVNPTGPFGVNNQTKVCGGPLNEFPLMGQRQLETTVNRKFAGAV